ncbi:PD-(D/E)XK motif protein [Sinorhizobium medicae]|nr:PD-(D/E)XK motif protein [Sinorhizobium medicae]
MAAPIDLDDLRAAWRALGGSREEEGWKTIAVTNAGPCVVLAGRRLPGDEEAVLVGFRNARTVSQLPQGHGFEVLKLVSAPMGAGRCWLALARRRGGSEELFAMMAEDLVRLLESSAAQDEDALFHQFLSRIRAWQDFMDRHREGVLSPEAELGLFGELVVIEHMIDAGMQALNVLCAWQGPLDGLQDFQLGSGAIEVKTTLSARGFPATITSLEQFDESLCQPLFLAAVRLSINSSGMTLPAMAESLRERLQESQSALDLFEVRLLQAGLLYTVPELYTRRFLHSSTAILPVADDFPRLTRVHVHPAIRKVRYEIDVSLAGVSDVGLSRALELLGII